MRKETNFRTETCFESNILVQKFVLLAKQERTTKNP